MSTEKTTQPVDEQEELNEQARAESPVEELPDPPERFRQDTHPVEGDEAIDPAVPQDMLQRPRLQG